MACLSWTFHSPSLRMATHAFVVLPEYPAQPQNTLILLHGLSGACDTWNRRTSIERYAQNHNLAVIMPEVQRSWYTDMVYGLPYFTFITDELPRLAANTLRVPVDPAHLYVGGLSMGGYGALKCALRAGDVFSRGASLSGAADIRQLPPGGYWEDVFGPREQIPGSFNDLFAAAEALPPENRPPLYMWCGTEDSLLPGNHALRDHLLALGYDLTYAESAGNHAWQWWDLHIQDVLRWLFPQTEVK